MVEVRLTVALLLILVCVLVVRRSPLSPASRSDFRPRATALPLPSSARVDLFDRAFYINGDDSPHRRHFMEAQLQGSGVRYERWPALRGSPALLRTHASYFTRGVERHLFLNKSNGTGELGAWGTIGTYLSHLTLFEHILRHHGTNESSAFLILQDDTKLRLDWLTRLGNELKAAGRWSRLLLVWWGLQRRRDCHGRLCVVRPPAGPTEPGDLDCCGKRFYHGLQAWIVRTQGLRCLVRRLKRRRIKNIDAQMVQCDCPRTFALPKGRMLGAHLDRELGSERAAVNSVWRAQLLTQSPPRKSAQRNLRKTRMTHLVKEVAAAARVHGSAE